MKTIKRVPDAALRRGVCRVGRDGRPGPAPRAPHLGNKITLGLFFALLALLVVGSIVKLPYAVMSPGPTVNTLGDTPGTSKPIITVDGTGRPTRPTAP